MRCERKQERMYELQPYLGESRTIDESASSRNFITITIHYEQCGNLFMNGNTQC